MAVIASEGRHLLPVLVLVPLAPGSTGREQRIVDEQIGNVAGVDRFLVGRERNERCGVANDRRGRPSRAAQVGDAAVAAGLTELLVFRFHDERVVNESRRPVPADQPCEPDLPARRGKEVGAADDERDSLRRVVD